MFRRRSLIVIVTLILGEPNGLGALPLRDRVKVVANLLAREVGPIYGLLGIAVSVEVALVPNVGAPAFELNRIGSPIGFVLWEDGHTCRRRDINAQCL